MSLDNGQTQAAAANDRSAGVRSQNRTYSRGRTVRPPRARL